MTIEIRVSAGEAQRATNDIHVGLLAIDRLKAAGVPVTGTLFPVSVTSGVLSIAEDVFGDIVYTWEP